MSLKEQIARDNETVFLNPEEFGVRIAVNGVETAAVEDGDQLNAYRAGGICQGERLYTAAPASLTGCPARATRLRLPRTAKRAFGALIAAGRTAASPS